jgi:glyoxylase-like metal-dependent hydrolase (beta-lactamase superfamily II)
MVMNSEHTRPIDVHHLGRSQVICAWLVGDVLIDPGPSSSIPALLDGLAGTVPRVIALTHIHLDHAGAAGSLVERWPDVRVWVHERGARHLIDPSRLLDSATRLYGDDMERLWGEVLPVPADNVTVLHGGERLDGLEVAYTPGHASHHVCYWHPDSATAFVGDVGGVRIEPLEYVLAPTPPPDIDIEAWHESIELVRQWSPKALAITHFGTVADPIEHLAVLDAQLDRWAALSRTLDREQFAQALSADVEQHCGAQASARYRQGAPFDHIYDGLARYWAKRDQAAAHTT